MSRPTKAQPKRLTVGALRRLRGELHGVARSLHDARTKTRDLAERSRIDGALREVGKRVERLGATVAAVASLKTKQKTYEEKIAKLEQRIERIIGRSYRGSYRWLQRWRNL